MTTALPRDEAGVATLPLSAYDADLGLRTRAAVRRQLELDLPRSEVRVRGARVTDAEAVLRATRAPRLCTQAVLAPVVEWFLAEGKILHEVMGGVRPMCVDLLEDEVVVRKTLGVGTWGGPTARTIDLTLAADLRHNMMVVEIERSQHPQ